MRLELLAISAISLACGCSSGDPGETLGGPRGFSDAGGSLDPDAAVAAAAFTDAGTTTSNPDAEPGVDAAPDVAYTQQDPFGPSAGAYAPHPVDVSAEQEHRRRSVVTLATGTECLGCHDGSKAIKFGFGGTIYRSADGGADAGGPADVEVRVVNFQGALYGSAHSDVDGNFWFATTNGLHAGSWSGIRDATGAKHMLTSFPKGGCNSSSCHDSTNRLHAP